MTTARGSGTPAALRSFESLLSNAWHVFSVQAVLSPTLHSSFQQTCWTRFGSTVPGKGLLSTLSNDLSPESVFSCRKFGLSLPPPLLPPLNKVSSVASHPAPGPKKKSARQARLPPLCSLLLLHFGGMLELVPLHPEAVVLGKSHAKQRRASAGSATTSATQALVPPPMQMLHGFFL